MGCKAASGSQRDVAWRRGLVAHAVDAHLSLDRAFGPLDLGGVPEGTGLESAEPLPRAPECRAGHHENGSTVTWIIPLLFGHIVKVFAKRPSVSLLIIF